jgi:DNA ligase-1
VRAFAELYTALDETNKTNEKIDALTRYFATAAPADAAWALYFLIGRRPKQAVASAKLHAWAVQAAGVPEWLFSECYDAVGDFAETIALLLPDEGPRTNDQGDTAESYSAIEAERTVVPAGPSYSSFVFRLSSLQSWVEDILLPLRGMDEAAQRETILGSWRALGVRERFAWNKLITGEFRVGVSQRLVVRAIAAVSGVEDAVIAHRLMGDWQPSAEFYARLLGQETSDADISRPYPFCLAHPLEDTPAALGEVSEWQAEWKWDGIRAQIVRRAGQTFIWTRGEELVTDRYPELVELGARLPDGTVIDGEILPWRDDGVLPFAQLQRRIGRKTIGKKLLSDVPVILMAYDLLEWQARDIRTLPLAERRERLEALVAEMENAELRMEKISESDLNSQFSILNSYLQLSPTVAADNWDDLAAARERSREINAEGLMLKRRSSIYRVGRVRGDWWKWKINPFTVDAVLIYAQRGTGKRASLYTDYTFGVWDGDQLVPFAKAYSGLTDAEIREVDAFIRRNTVEKFGPVRTVKPELVFELAFEAIQRSSRHKSGIAVRFPRILRWRTDKRMEEADSLETIRALLPEE